MVCACYETGVTWIYDELHELNWDQFGWIIHHMQVFINVPWWYLAANKMMSPFLTQRTKSKFTFCSPAKTAETLFRFAHDNLCKSSFLV